MNYPDHAMEAYRLCCKEFWEVSEAHENVMPHPVSFRDKPSPWTFEQWNRIRDLVLKPTIEKKAKLELRYPGIGEEYEERRFLACQAEEDRRMEDHYR